MGRVEINCDTEILKFDELFIALFKFQFYLFLILPLFSNLSIIFLVFHFFPHVFINFFSFFYRLEKETCKFLSNIFAYCRIFYHLQRKRRQNETLLSLSNAEKSQRQVYFFHRIDHYLLLFKVSQSNWNAGTGNERFIFSSSDYSHRYSINLGLSEIDNKFPQLLDTFPGEKQIKPSGLNRGPEIRVERESIRE